MMAVHLVIFNIFTIAVTVSEVVYWGNKYNYFHMTYWQSSITVESFGLVAYIAYFILN